MNDSHALLRRISAGILLVSMTLAAPVLALVNSEPLSDEAFDAEFPWLVAVASPLGPGICGGVLIAPQWVLTAAHCSGQTKVILTGSAEKAKARRIEVVRSIRHPQFSKETLQYDVGLLQLAAPVEAEYAPLISAAELPLLLMPGREAVIFGWGRTEDSREPVARVQRGTVKLKEFGVQGTQIGYRFYGGGPCGRDSGSPMLLRASDGSYRVVGLASAAEGGICNKGGGAAIYTNVGTVWAFINRFVEFAVPAEPSAD